MPKRFLVEMFCDRVAASKIYKGKDYKNEDALLYFTKGNAAKKMHHETAFCLEKWLRMLAEQGEEITFAEIRREVKESKRQKHKTALTKP
jgi:hypothetical protein